MQSSKQYHKALIRIFNLKYMCMFRMAQYYNDIITNPRSFYKLNGVSCYSLLKLQFDVWCLLSSQSHFSKNLLRSLSNVCFLSLLGCCHIEIGFHKASGLFPALLVH